MSSFFSGVTQRTVDVRGTKARIPVLYRDATMMSAVYSADLDAVRGLIPIPGFTPLSLFPGRALVGVACMEYKDVEIGSYHEFAISVGVSPDGASARPRPLRVLRSILERRYDCHIVTLPVTTEIAWHGGVDLYGYPKYLGDISFEDRAEERVCTLRDKKSGEVIFRFTGRKLPAESHERKLLVMDSFAMLGGRPLLARFRLNQRELATRYFGGNTRIERGPHPSGKLLDDLGLGAEIQYMWAPKVEAILEEPKPL